MSNVNDIFNNTIIDNTFELLLTDQWRFLSYNDVIIVEKYDNTKNKYFFKNINDKNLLCGNSKYKNIFNKQFKYIPFKFVLTNVKNIYRQSQIYYNLDLIKIIKKINSLENENKLLKKQLKKLLN